MWTVLRLRESHCLLGLDENLLWVLRDQSEVNQLIEIFPSQHQNSKAFGRFDVDFNIGAGLQLTITVSNRR